jgi:branched-chain amino acid transport system substrate-binding protein
LIVDTVDTSEELAAAGDYVFAVGIYDEGIGYIIAEHAKALGKEKVAIVYYQAEPFVVYVKDAMKQKLESLGGEVVIEQGYAPSETDFKTVLMKAQKEGAEAIVALGYDELGMLLKQKKELGIEMPVIGMDTLSSETLREIAGDAAEGVYMPYWEAADAEGYAAMTEKFKQKFGQEPEQPLFTSTSYDAMKIVAKAMEKAGSGEDVKDALYNVKGHAGVTGIITMGEDGIVRSIQEEMYQISGGELVKIE